jgi:hypothetical protein
MLPLIVAVAAAAFAQPSDEGLKSFVDDRVGEWWVKPKEKRFDEIGWAPNLMTARRLANEHDRPVFLFTMDGRVNLGRC